MVSRLRRLSVGPFTESDAISLAFLEKLEHSAAAFEHLKLCHERAGRHPGGAHFGR